MTSDKLYTVSWNYSTGGHGDASFEDLRDAMGYYDQRRADAKTEKIIAITVDDERGETVTFWDAKNVDQPVNE
jgi:hypothetical protein